jgi:hypothetical protein
MAHTLLQRSSGLTWKATTARVVVAILAPLYCPRMSFGEARGHVTLDSGLKAPPIGTETGVTRQAIVSAESLVHTSLILTNHILTSFA